ncbi:MAG: DUF1565 domain-containing protein [Coriobacteriia bacterium]
MPILKEAKRGARCLSRVAAAACTALLLLSVVAPALLAGFPTGVSEAFAASAYYVSPSGSDTNAGTLASPWRTVQKAANTAKAGDTVYVRAGTYSERVTVSGSGTASAPILLRGYEGERPLVTQGFALTGSYITVQQFEITPGYQGGSNGTRAALYVGGSYNTADNIYIHDLAQTSRQTAVLVFGSHGTVSNSRVINYCTYNASATGASVENYGRLINTYFEAESQIRCVEVGDNASVIGCQLIGPNEDIMLAVNGSHVLVKDTLLYKEGRRKGTGTHTEMIGISCTSQTGSSLTDITFDGCVVGNPPNGDWGTGVQYEGAPFHVFFFGTVSGSTYDNVHFTNNVFLGGADRIADQNPGTGCLTNVTWCNNLFTGIAGPALDDSCVWRNNICGNGFEIRNVSGGETQDADYNLYWDDYHSSKPSIEGSHTRVGDPAFLSPVVSAATRWGIDADWHIGSSSAAINKGLASSLTPAVDKSGNARVGATDIGPYEWTGTSGASVPGSSGSGAETPASSETPAAPTTPSETPVATTPAPGKTFIYRFYNKVNGSHFYTASQSECNAISANYSATYLYEGVAYTANTANPANDDSLYRFYNKVNGSHFYTVSASERDRVIANYSATYQYEGAAYLVSSTASDLPVYRFYNTHNGSHFYTVSESERDRVIENYSATYLYEGVAFWVGQ